MLSFNAGLFFKKLRELLKFFEFQKGLKNVFDEAILAALEPPEPQKKRKCVLL